MTRILHLYGICLHKFEGVESIQQNCTVSIQISLGEYLVLKTLRLSAGSDIIQFNDTFSVDISDLVFPLELLVSVYVNLLQYLPSSSKPLAAIEGSFLLSCSNSSDPSEIKFSLRSRPSIGFEENSSLHGVCVMFGRFSSVVEEPCTRALQTKHNTIQLIFPHSDHFIEDFFCFVEQSPVAGNSVPGRLYVTAESVLFYGRFFNRSRKIEIPLILVEDLTLSDSGSIVITVASGAYVFEGFFDSQRCYDLLLVCSESAKSDAASGSQGELQQPLVTKDSFSSDESIGEENVSSDKLFLREWKMISKGASDLSTVVLPVGLTHFCSLFVDDKCSFSLKRFHDRLGDRAKPSSPWTPSAVTSAPFSESIRATKVTRSAAFFGLWPSGSQQSRQVSIQRLRNYSDEALIISSSIRFEDVPSCETFTAEDHLLVIPDGDIVVVKAVVDLTFNQFSHLRSLFEAKLLEDRQNFVLSYLQYIKQICEAHAKRRSTAYLEYSGLRSLSSSSPPQLSSASISRSEPSVPPSPSNTVHSKLFSPFKSPLEDAAANSFTPFADDAFLTSDSLKNKEGEKGIENAKEERRISFEAEFNSTSSIDLSLLKVPEPAKISNSSQALLKEQGIKSEADKSRSKIESESVLAPTEGRDSQSTVNNRFDTPIVQAYRKNNNVCLLCGHCDEKVAPESSSMITKEEMFWVLFIVLCFFAMYVLHINAKIERFEKKIDSIEQIFAQLILPNNIK